MQMWYTECEFTNLTTVANCINAYSYFWRYMTGKGGGEMNNKLNDLLADSWSD